MKASGKACPVCFEHKGKEFFHTVRECMFLKSMHNKFVSSPQASDKTQDRSGRAEPKPYVRGSDQRKSQSHLARGRANLATSVFSESDSESEDDFTFGSCMLCAEDLDDIPALVSDDEESSSDDEYYRRPSPASQHAAVCELSPLTNPSYLAAVLEANSTDGSLSPLSNPTFLADVLEADSSNLQHNYYKSYNEVQSQPT